MKTLLIILLLTGCASVLPGLKTIAETIGPIFAEALVDEVEGRILNITELEAACLKPDKALAKHMAEFVGDDDDEWYFMPCGVKIR